MIYDDTKELYIPIKNKKTLAYFVTMHLQKENINCNWTTAQKVADICWTEIALSPSEHSCEAFDFLPLQNGILINSTVATQIPTLQSFSSEKPMTYKLNINFHEYNTCNPYPQPTVNQPTPTWDGLLNLLTGNNITLMNRINEMLAYLLIPDNQAKKFFLLQGRSNTGKSLLTNFIKDYFPKDKLSFLSLEQLGNKYSTSTLNDKLLNIYSDLPAKQLLDKAIATLKMLTGHDQITLETNDHKMYSYNGRCKFLFATNFPIKMDAYDQAFENRIVCIPFTHEIQQNNAVITVLQQLENERSAIAINAIMQHYPRLVNNNYVFSGSNSIKADIIYSSLSNDDAQTISDFIDNCCMLVAFNQGKTHTQKLYNSYKQYCQDTGAYPVSYESFGRFLPNIRPNKLKSSKWTDPESSQRLNGYEGIIIKALSENIPFDNSNNNQPIDLQHLISSRRTFDV